MFETMEMPRMKVLAGRTVVLRCMWRDSLGFVFIVATVSVKRNAHLLSFTMNKYWNTECEHVISIWWWVKVYAKYGWNQLTQPAVGLAKRWLHTGLVAWLDVTWHWRKNLGLRQNVVIMGWLLDQAGCFHSTLLCTIIWICCLCWEALLGEFTFW